MVTHPAPARQRVGPGRRRRSGGRVFPSQPGVLGAGPAGAVGDLRRAAANCAGTVPDSPDRHGCRCASDDSTPDPQRLADGADGAGAASHGGRGPAWRAGPVTRARVLPTRCRGTGWRELEHVL